MSSKKFFCIVLAVLIASLAVSCKKDKVKESEEVKLVAISVYPEEIETIIAELPYVKENIVFGEVRREGADDRDEVLVAKIVYDEDLMKEKYGAFTEAQIRETVERDLDRINSNMPKYKHVHRLILQTEEMAKTTTGKVKRYEEKERV